MTATEIALLQRLANERPSRGTRTAAGEALAKQFGIGLVIGRHIEYATKDYEAAAKTLSSHGQQLEALGPAASRSDAAARPGLSEKIGTLRPHSDSIAVRVAAGSVTGPDGPLCLPAGGYAVLNFEALAGLRADRLMLVENLATFRTLQNYRWIDYRGLNVLAIFRGDTLLGPDFAARALRERHEPIWLFADFDPAGLGIALQLERLGRLERVVAPAIDWLVATTQEKRRTDLFSAQEGQYRQQLDAAEHPEIQRLWRALASRAAGLPQEWMVDAPADGAFS